MPLRYLHMVHVKNGRVLSTCNYAITLAVGEFNETSATQFCMTVTDINVEGFAFDHKTNSSKE